MSRDAEVIVLARWSDEVMEPLTQDDPERTWRGRFVPIAGHWGYKFGWALEFEKMRARKGLLKHLESLPWPHPHTVQVLLRDQDDDCFGLWMFQEGRLVEATIPRTERFHQPAPPNEDCHPDPGSCAPTKTRLCPNRPQKHAATPAHPGRPSSTADLGTSGLSTRA
ncbi:hypothetical protein ACH470_07570 [Streptomyces bottropensis]|uniref:hypothetical protein n=1 Tax=Streptomyces bottropensis TaxID=42235 RepID=UPI0037B23C35